MIDPLLTIPKTDEPSNPDKPIDPEAADLVNGSITDAVTQTHVAVVAQAPTMAMGSLYQTMSHSNGVLFENIVSSQNLQTMSAQATATQGILQMYILDTIADAVSIAKVLNK